ncbi:31401_t:CDS:2 [Gigaspora margarita]|uniref:31401_t:CDS:1 n=1 Tax=Gigaspora margarita TaxID=4874 RepID=A0ABN7UU03_GIGMA|nr:31401_t:CDS:2 [Gigaspora margarita]
MDEACRDSVLHLETFRTVTDKTVTMDADTPTNQKIRVSNEGLSIVGSQLDITQQLSSLKGEIVVVEVVENARYKIVLDGLVEVVVVNIILDTWVIFGGVVCWVLIVLEEKFNGKF